MHKEGESSACARAADEQTADGRADVVARLRVRRGELVAALFARVRSVVADSVGDRDPEYVAGLRGAVEAAVDYVLAGLQRGHDQPAVPEEVLAQARRAARSGVSLDAVLRRYMAGQALLGD